MVTKKEQLIFTEKRQIKDGVTNGNVWVLYGYKTENGYEYSSLESTITLNEPVFVIYTEREVPKTKGEGVFINRRIESTKPISEKNFGTEKVTQLDRIEALLEELQTQVVDVQSAVDRLK